MEEQRAKLLELGLDKQTVENTLKSKNTLASLNKTLSKIGNHKLDKKQVNLLYAISTKIGESLENRRQLLVDFIIQNKIVSNQQLDYSFEFLNKNTQNENLNLDEFSKYIGVGVHYTDDQIKEIVKQYVESKSEELKKIRYTFNYTEYLRNLREKHKFADGSKLNAELKPQIEALLGPKTKEDEKLVEEAKKNKDKKPAATEADQNDEGPRKKITDLVARDLKSAVNQEKHLKWKVDNFGEAILTRFPPEPNGYLHIGHAKAIRFNFTVASSYNGHTYLRFDDTNPEKECKEYIDNIKENLSWLGYKPWKVTHASDNFEKLYNFAIELIKKGLAYCCFLKKEESQAHRKAGTPSPYRDTSVEENLRIFKGMKMGLYAENQVCLKAKIDYQHANANLRDPVMYRIRYTPHPHAGNKWCIYPMYDYTHGICDSLEGITHSLCTLEFEIRRELYYWFLEALDLYRPFVWEYSRLNISNTVLSKRLLHRLIFEKYVSGWDDPRIMTLNGLRRRGYTSDAINEFCDIVSVTRSGNENFIGLHLLEHCIRTDLDQKAPRTMVVLDPILCVIENLEKEETIEVRDFPKDASKGTHTVLLSKEIYVDESDVKLEDSKDFWGIGPGKVVGLKYVGAVKVKHIEQKNGKVTQVTLTKLGENAEKPKGMIHWISVKESVDCEVRLYDILFNAYNPNQLENYLDGLNPNSLVVKNNAKMQSQLLKSEKETRLQFERLGYFVIDKDSSANRKVWNRTVTLQEREKVKALGKN